MLSAKTAYKRMYDKVKIWMDKAIVGEQFTTIADLLDEANTNINHQTGEVKIYGSLGGLKLSIFPNGIYIVGSLPKYMYGSNIYPLDRETTKRAFERLEDSLHTSLNEAKVTGFEFGANFVMRHGVESYLDRLGDMPRMLLYRFNRETLYYHNRGKKHPKTFCFYDKIAEAKKEQGTIPKGLQDANLLRCEIRLDGKLSKQMNVPEVTPQTLSDKSFYRKVMQKLTDAYFSISKINQLKLNFMSKINTVSDAFNVFVALLISKVGESEIRRYLNELKDNSVFKDRNNYSRLKKKIQEVATKANITDTDELIKELDDEFRNVGAYV